jgi:L-ascorbate metabolism protein UlaG (beta-lactamase superfamily)
MIVCGCSLPSPVARTLVCLAALLAPAVASGPSAQTQAVRPNPAPGDPAPPADVLMGATGGPITIVPAGHASVQISHNGLWIDIDPTDSRALMPLREPDVILVTDIHGDHMDLATIRKLRGQNTMVIGPPAVAEQVMYTTTLENSEHKTVWGADIEAVPMYNVERGPATGKVFHPRGRGNGYVVTIGGKRLYIAGDTECTPEMKALSNIDAAFVPMNVPYTMSPAEAAECVKAFKPAVVYPYHYRGQDPSAFAAALENYDIEVRLRDWYPAQPARRASVNGTKTIEVFGGR